MATLCWSSMCNPLSLSNVGMDAVCMQSDNAICFTNMKTKQRTFYKADSAVNGAGISALCGHSRFPLVAFSECVLRPQVIIIKYPELTKFASYACNTNLQYIDMRFTAFDHLVLLTGHPKYTIKIWNYRTDEIVGELDTYSQYTERCLICSVSIMPRILLLSNWRKDITIYDTCLNSSGEAYTLHEVAKIKLHKRFLHSHIFSMCFGENRVAHIVDDYGSVWTIQSGQISLKPLWQPPAEDGLVSRRHYLYYLRARTGFLVGNDRRYTFLAKRHDVWVVDSIIQESEIDRARGIEKALANFNTEIYVVNNRGGLSRIEYQPGRCTLVECQGFVAQVTDYVLLKGLKEEVILLMTASSTFRLCDMMRMTLFSFLYIPHATTVVSHNILPIVAVGDKSGLVRFISYEKIRAPIFVGSIDIESSILGISMMDNITFVYDAFYGIHILRTDFPQHHLFIQTSLQRLKAVHITYAYLTSATRALVFLTPEIGGRFEYATEMWIYTWAEGQVECIQYKLPHRYRYFTFPISSGRDVDFYALRIADSVIDFFQLNSVNEVHKAATIRTTHLSNLFGIAGSRNMVSWGVDGIMCHFRQHKKSIKPFHIARFVQTLYVPRVIRRSEECYNGKYLIVFYAYGSLKVYKMSLAADNLRENEFVSEELRMLEFEQQITPNIVKKFKEVKTEPLPEDFRIRDELKEDLKKLTKEVTDLIEYDISVTGKTEGIFRKFCLNQQWLRRLTEEAQILFDTERKSMVDSTTDQARIRDWMLDTILGTTSGITVKLRSVFAKGSLEGYSIGKAQDRFRKFYNYFRFFDMKRPVDEGIDEDDEEANKKSKKKKHRKLFEIDGNSVYDHVMRSEFALQDLNIVSSNQIQNQMAKFKPLLADALRREFNKIFDSSHDYKQEMMNNINATNAKLMKIYSNMNCMRCLLNKKTFEPPKLSVPEWMNDEVLDRIMTVDDSEIKAINRRKKKAELEAYKSGRMLLWPPEFWARALMIMMDGVLEKLWEEEIKKDIPLPEFMTKRKPHEYTLDDQRALREYEAKVHQLELDRRKYLGMLHDDEDKVQAQKEAYIVNINACIAKTSLQKLKYDFAIKTHHMRILSTKLEHMERVLLCDKLLVAKTTLDKSSEYAARCSNLADYWERTMVDTRIRLDHIVSKSRQFDRQFKSFFLNPIQPNMANELQKQYRKRPKMNQRSFNSSLVCFELAARVVHKHTRKNFPLPLDVMDFLSSLDEMDELEHSPPQLDIKYWEGFVKQRRMRIELELKERATQIQLLDAQNSLNAFLKDVKNLKYAREDLNILIDNLKDDYVKSVRNRRLQITLNLGQVEVSTGGSLDKMENNILMNVKDIDAVNLLIKKAGNLKLKAMQKVAMFRRQVLYKEWEHKVIRANIEYLKYMLHVIQKCKVTMEFLDILRNWKKTKKKRQFYSTFNVIENVVAQRIAAHRRHLEELCDKIDHVKLQLEDMRRRNNLVNKEIDEMRVDVTLLNVHRDFIYEEREVRMRKERMAKISRHHALLQKVRADYVHVLELRTILELQRLRTYPTLGVAPTQCEPSYLGMHFGADFVSDT